MKRNETTPNNVQNEQAYCLCTFLCCVCVCTGSSAGVVGKSQFKADVVDGAAAKRISCGL